MAGFRHKFGTDDKRPAIPVLVSSTSPTVTTTHIGYLFVTASTAASIGPHGQLPVSSTADQTKVIGIVSYVPQDTTAGSSNPIYVTPILPGDFIEANYSTNVEKSTGGASVIVSTNIHRYLGIGSTGGGNGVALGYYIDPSIASTSPGTTDCLFFRMLGYSTQNDSVWGTINSSHLVW